MPALVRHPDTPCAAVARIDVGVVRIGAGLAMRYVLSGDVMKMRRSSKTVPERTGDLWKTTCFEAFVHKADGGYCEFNFAPSTQWAAYEFDSYRDGMRNLIVPAPKIEASLKAKEYSLDVLLDLRGNVDETADWRLAITAVIEENSGAKSYWALKHPPGKPDFHHADGFDLIVSAEG